VGLAEGAFDEVGVADSLPVLSREPQVEDEVLEVFLEALDSGRVQRTPLQAEALRPATRLGLARVPGCCSMPSKIAQ